MFYFLFLSHTLSCVRLSQVAITRKLILPELDEVKSAIPTPLKVRHQTELIFIAFKYCIKTILTVHELAVNRNSKSFWMHLYETCYTKLRRKEIVACNKDVISS